MAIDKNELLAKIKELLEPEVTKISYDTWIMPLDIRSIEGDNIVFTTISEFQKDFIENKYRSLIFNTLRYITNKDWTFSVVDLSKEDALEEKPNDIIKDINKEIQTIRVFSNTMAGMLKINVIAKKIRNLEGTFFDKQKQKIIGKIKVLNTAKNM